MSLKGLTVVQGEMVNKKTFLCHLFTQSLGATSVFHCLQNALSALNLLVVLLDILCNGRKESI